MNILQSWSHCLTIFKPSSLKLFLLVTLKSIIETYKILFTRFWWAVLFFVVLVFVSCLNIRTQTPIWYTFFLLLLLRLIAMVVMTFLLYLLIRPSVLKKNTEYIKGYGIHLLTLLLFFSVVILAIGLTGGIIAGLATAFVGDRSSLVPFNGQFLYVLLSVLITYVSIVMPFFYFFFLDSDGRFSSAWQSAKRACKMTLYTLPFIAVVYTFAHIIGYALQYALTILLGKLPPFIVISGVYEIAYVQAILAILIVLSMPIMGCFWNNFYIKNIHENFDLYFKRKEA
ncbi:MAG: hypothetical protein P4L31_06525 [Candidatus Babeliales bacterium]|nr:hypothetical protein [Candidatus Babeliales bacterium]